MVQSSNCIQWQKEDLRKVKSKINRLTFVTSFLGIYSSDNYNFIIIEKTRGERDPREDPQIDHLSNPACVYLPILRDEWGLCLRQAGLYTSAYRLGITLSEK